MNYHTATQISHILTEKMNKRITRKSVQKALVELGYTEKIGRKYIPTTKGENYSRKLITDQYSFYVWQENIMLELESIFR